MDPEDCLFPKEADFPGDSCGTGATSVELKDDMVFGGGEGECLWIFDLLISSFPPIELVIVDTSVPALLVEQ